MIDYFLSNMEPQQRGSLMIFSVFMTLFIVYIFVFLFIIFSAGVLFLYLTGKLK